ncbi:hypothetical protein V1264_007110 [Littorina saxatilis]
MAASMATATEIRKLRKKLRQIENLERLTRQLDEQETVKISKKYDLRERLQELLKQEENETFSSQRDPESTLSSLSSESFGEEAAQVSGKGDVSLGTRSANLNTSAGEGGNMKDKVPESHGKVVSSPVTDQPVTEEKSDKASKIAKKGNISRSDRKYWDQLSVSVCELDGHNDMVTALSVQGTTLVTASRDTTVKVWDLEKREETGSLGGHTETVTSVLIISPEETAALTGEGGDEGGKDSYIVSGSTDCTLKVWSLKTGKEVKSVYTFSPVTCLDYCYTTHLLVTASDGGKVELWDLRTAENVCSVRAHEEAVTGVKVQQNTVISSGADGLVMVHEVRARSLMRVFVSEDVKLTSGSGKVHQRMIRSLAAAGHTVVLGDDAINIKLLDWKKGVVSKLVNHVSEFASTDAVCLWDDLLFSSSYDLDHGTGYINVRAFSSREYLATLDDEEMEGTDRIVCLACTRLPSGNTVIISGGPQLKLWELIPPGQSAPESSDEKWVIVTQFLPELSRPAQDSEAESEADDTDDDDANDDYREKRKEDGDYDEETKSWCTIV